jgi:hypothetical protein
MKAPSDEIMRVANAITEEEVEVEQDEVLAVVVVILVRNNAVRSYYTSTNF